MHQTLKGSLWGALFFISAVFAVDAQDYTRVLPGAVTFEQVEGKPYLEGRNAAGELVGWVVLSTEVTDTVGYSGKPLVTLVGLDVRGNIAGARVLSHNEPILLVGIPEQDLHDFVDAYTGRPADAKVVVGRTDDPDAILVDSISGATVTVLAQNRTILDTARTLGADVGLFEGTAVLPGHFVTEEEPWSWRQLIKKKVFGRLTVTGKDMGHDADTFIDLYYTLADAPQVGRALLAPGEYNWLMKQLKPGEHLLVVLGNGASSFKGSGFVRGGMFDRIRLEQKLSVHFFRDTDHYPISKLQAPDAPMFNEASVFITRGPLDPGLPFDMIFLGSRYDGKGAFSREFHAFKSTFRMPRSVYQLDVPDPQSLIWRQAWHNKQGQVVVLGLYLLLITALFIARRWTTADMKRLRMLHNGSMLFGLLVVGFVLGAQPSITQILTLVGKLRDGGGFDLFLSEPPLFIFWIFIAGVTLVWGRGVFCGWVCPYGALTEMVFKVGHKLGLKSYELPEKIHHPLRYLRYLLLAGLIPIFLVSPEWGERLAEVEPFKTTFFLVPWTRHWLFFGWWLALLGLSVVMWRPFCRYLCPLGAALALPSSFRPSPPLRRRFCTSCNICTRGCEPRAIRFNGTIDPRECLSCMECEANFRDDTVCPPLVGLAKLPPFDQMSEREKEKADYLKRESIEV